MKKFSVLTLLMVAMFTLFSCSNKPKDDQLSGFLLMGPYTLSAKPQVLNTVPEDTDNDALVAIYKQGFEFPYPQSLTLQGQQILLNEFQVTDKHTTLKAIDAQMAQAKESNHKAFNYAVAANIASWAYCTGYFTKEDVLAENNKILTETRKHYSDWEKYLDDFKEGRRAANKPQQERFDQIVAQVLLAQEHSPYKKVVL